MIHLVYPYGERHAAPWSIGNHVADGLRSAGHSVRQYDWQDRGLIPQNGPDDILIGHPCPEENRIFLSNLGPRRWTKKIAMCPFNGSDSNLSFISSWIERVDHFIAICGPYWEKFIPPTWRQKTTCVDMAINPAHYPFLKRQFNPRGNRGFLYIGCTGPEKGTGHLMRIIAACKGVRWGHIGYGLVGGCIEHGYLPLDDEAVASKVCAAYDFLVMPGKNDANPTTALEAACWGMIPITADGCGWTEFGRLDDNPIVAARDLEEVNWIGQDELHHMQTSCRSIALTYTWDKMVDRILEILK